MSSLQEGLTKFKIDSKFFNQQPTFTFDMYSVIQNLRGWDYLKFFDKIANTKYSENQKIDRLHTSFNMDTLEYNDGVIDTVNHNIMPMCIHRNNNHFIMESYNYDLFKKMYQNAIEEKKSHLIIPIKEEYNQQFKQTLLIINLKNNQTTYYNPSGFRNHFYNSNDNYKDMITSYLEAFLNNFVQKFVKNPIFQFHETNEELNQEFNFSKIRYNFDNGQNFMLTFILSNLLNNGLNDVKSFYKLVNSLSDIGQTELIYNFASSVYQEFNISNTPEDKTNKSSSKSPLPYTPPIEDEYEVIEDESNNTNSLTCKTSKNDNKDINDSLLKSQALEKEISRLQQLLNKVKST